MKKDKGVLGTGIFLIAMLLADVYVLKNVDSAVIFIVVGAITIGAAYLVFDRIYALFLRQQEEKEALKAFVEAHYKEADKADKAKYLVLKRTQELLEERLSKIEEAEQQLQDAFGQLVQEENKNAKFIVKYNREDMKRLAALSREDTEKLLAAIDRLSQINSSLEIAQALEGMNKNLAALGGRTNDFSRIMEEEPVAPEPDLSGLDEQMQLGDMDEIETQLADLEEEQSREEEPAGPELDLSDPNKQMGQDDIAALLASMEAEESKEAEEEPAVPELDLSDPNKQMGQDDIEALLASMEAEESKEAEEEPAVPELDLSDPNKQMGQDDIAALLASMGVGEDSTVQEEASAEAASSLEESSGDANKQLSPDEIAALFSSLE